MNSTCTGYLDECLAFMLTHLTAASITSVWPVIWDLHVPAVVVAVGVSICKLGPYRHVITMPGLVQKAERPLPGCIIMSDGRFRNSTEEQHEAFANRSAGDELPYWEAGRVANSFYARQHGCARGHFKSR